MVATTSGGKVPIEQIDTSGIRSSISTKIAATVTAATTAPLGQHLPVNAATAAVGITLPTGAPDGSQVSVEKIDASANLVTVTGSVRGTPATTLTLYWLNEAVQLIADAAGSWWPVSGHKTKTAPRTAGPPRKRSC